MKTNPILLEKLTEQLRDILSEGEFDSGEIAAAATKAGSMMRKGKITVDWSGLYKERQRLNNNQTA